MGHGVFVILELVGTEGGKRLGRLIGLLQRPFKAAFFMGYCVERCAVHLKQQLSLAAHPVRHEYVYRVLGECAYGGECNAGIAAGHLHYGLARLQQAPLLRYSHDMPCHAVLYAAAEVVALKLRVYFALFAVQFIVYGGHGGVAYKLLVG